MDNSDNILVRYLDGELNVAEKQELEHELNTNARLKADLESLQSTRKAIRLYGLKQKVGSIHSQMMNELSSSKTRTAPRKLIRYTIAAAASILLLVGTYMIYNFVSLSPDKIYTSRYQPYELVNVRSGQERQTAVEKAYREKNYSLVLKIHSENKPFTVKDGFLCGVSALELNDNVKAIDCFNSVLKENWNSGNQAYIDAAEYYLALTYIRNKDYDYALDLLRSIRDNKTHLYNEKATAKLLRQVRMLKWR